MAKNIKVYCEKTGKEFNSLKDAAKELGLDSWTLSRKIESNGFFVDENGNKWKKTEKMKTKNKYKKTTPYYKEMKHRIFGHRKPNKSKVPNIDGQFDAGLSLFPIVSLDKKPRKNRELEQSVIRVVEYMLKNNGAIDKIKELLNLCDLDEIKLTIKKD